MLDPSPFYHSTTQNVLNAFGVIFKDIIIGQFKDGELLNTRRVPIAYGPASKWLRRSKDRQDLEDKKIALKVPRISYEIASISEDSTRRLPRGNKWQFGDTSNTGEFQYMEVPYMMDITMSIITKTREEGFQIVEQIVPYFVPDMTLSVKGLYGPSEKRSNLPVILTGVDPADESEGTGEDRDVLTWTLSFTVKYNYAGRVINKALIRTAEVDIVSDAEGDAVTAKVVGVNDTPLNNTIETIIEQIDLSK